MSTALDVALARADAISPQRRVWAGGCPVSKETMVEWQKQLESVIPVTQHLSHLRVVYDPGDEWAPRERFVLYQMKPIRKPGSTGKVRMASVGIDETLAVHPDIWAALNGPHPRSTGHPCFAGLNGRGHPWCACPIKAHRWVGGPEVSGIPGMTRLVWELYNETGFYGERYWIIQGEHGGHRWALTDAEEKFLELTGGGQHFKGIPRTGALPFAPFDNRVLDHVRRYDLLRRHTLGRDFSMRGGDDIAREMHEAKVQAAEMLAAHLAHQTDLWLTEHAAPWLRHVRDNFVDPTRDRQILDEEAVHKRFVATASA